MWSLFALITSFLYAFYYICNQQSKIKAEIFIIYRGFFVAIVATPFMLIYRHTFPWQFYIIVLFQGLLISYSDYKYFQAFQKFGAENINSIKPLSILITFILWLFICPSTIFTYLKNPKQTFLIIASLLAIIYAAMKYRNQKIGRDSLKFTLPLLFFSSALDVSNKLITEYNDNLLLPLTFHRVALTGWIIGFINLFFYHQKLPDNKKLFNFSNVYSCSFLLLLIFSMITINLSMYYSPHPAYTSAIIYLSVIWIIIINKIKLLLGKKTIYKPIALRWILLLLSAAITLLLSS